MRRILLAAVGVLLVAVAISFSTLLFWLRSDGVRQAIVAQAQSASGLPVRIDGAGATLFPRPGVALVNVAIDQPPRAQFDVVSIAVPLRTIWTRRLEDADLYIRGGHSDTSLLGILSTPRPDRSPERTQTLSIVSVRSIRVRQVALASGGSRIPFDLDASLQDDRLRLPRIELRAGGSLIRIAGELSSLARLEGHFDVTSAVLPVAELVAILDGLVPARPRGATQAPFRLTAALSASVATIGADRIESFVARLEATPRAIIFDPVTFNLAGGRFEGRISTVGFDPPFHVRGQVTNLDTAGLRTDHVTGSKGFAGRLDATFAIQTAPFASAAAMIDNAKGSVDIVVRDGRMPGIEVVRTAILRFAGRADAGPPSAGSDTFSRLSAATTLQGGNIRIERLTMTAADFDLAGAGAYRPASGRLSLAADVTLSESLSAEAGRDLYRYARDGRRIVLPVIIGGTLSTPTATIDVAQAAGRALRNRAEDEAKSILDRLLKGRD
jgi:hypothetical protein